MNDASKKVCEDGLPPICTLSGAAMIYAQQTAMLSAILACVDRNSLAELIDLCNETQRQYLAAKNALETHRRNHRC